MRNRRDIPPGILCLLFCFTICQGIYIPSQEEAKPAYTAGIKTTFRKPSDAATFQNYSKVVVDHKPNTPAASYVRNEYRTVEIKNIYPVYNAHTYGQIPPQNHTNILQTKSHQEINAGKIGFSTEHPNKTIIKRKIESKTIEVYSKCFPGATGQFIYSSSCNQFLNCWKGRGSVQNCAPGTLFNPKSLECDFPEKVQCVSGPQSNSFEQVRVEKSVEQADCPDGFSGIIPDYFDCSKFIQCDHGVSYKMECAPGTLFDMKNNLCDYPYKATCFNGENAIDIRMKPNTYSINTNTGGTTCNNEHQNCGQTSRQPNHYGYNYQQTVHTGLYCNPQIQNCNTGHSTTYGQGTTYDQGTNYGQGTNTRNDNYGGYTHYGQVGNEVETKVSSTQNRTNGQGTYNQGTYGQGTYNTELHGQGTYKPGSYRQETYNPGSYGQGTYNTETTYGQGTYNQQTYGQTTYDQGTSGQETSIYPQVSGSSGCNSATQNCRPSGQTVIYTQTVIQGCNPNLQNCGQNNPNEGQQTYESNTETTKCNPLTRNCQPVGEYLGNGHGELRRHNCNPAIHNCDQYISQFSANTPGCNPTIQNCDQYIGQSSTNTYTYFRQTGNGQTDIAPAVDSTYTQTNTLGSGDGKQNVASCNPLVQKCITIYGPNTGYQTIPINKPKTGARFVCNLSEPNCGHGQENENTGENTPNYRKICSIHDTNCRQQQSTGTETVQHQPSNTQPVCPNGAVGMRKHPTDCKKYLTCGSGQTFVMDCAPGTLFNDKTGMCDFPYNVKCEVTAESVDIIPSDTQYEQNVINYQKTTTERSYNPYPDSNKWNQQSNTKWNQQTHTNWNENRGSNWGQQTTNWDLHNGQQTINNAKQETDIWDQQPVAENNRGQTGYIKNPTKKPVYPDYDDVYNPNSHAALATTPRSATLPAYETGNNNIDVDYIFTYDDGTLVTIDPKNVRKAKENISTLCEESDFYRCSSNLCILLTMVCDGNKDCPDGKDEDLCEEYTQRFSVTKNAQLVVVENQRWINVSYSTCALLCIQNTKFTCRSFTYRKSDKTCFLSDKNIGLSGALQPHQSSDYSELKDGTIDCSNKSKYFECPNKRCLSKDFLCDGYDDCGDRHDEKHCDPKKFQYSIKLAGGKETHEGRVEVKAFGSEGYICDDEFGIEDANVICRELGFELGAAEVKGQSQFAQDIKESSTLYMIDDLNCRGNESTIIDCTFPGWGIHNCKDQEIAGVVCKTPQEKCGEDSWKCDSGKECIPFEFVCDGVEDCADDSDESNEHCEAPTELRLKGGSHSAEGRIEIKHNGIWGTICDDDFNEDAGKVVCKLLGYKGAVTVKKDGYFGAGFGPIWLDQVSCYGNETELQQCTHWNWGEHNCEHSEDVGVTCTNEIGQVQIERHSNLPRRIEEGLPTNCGLRKDNLFAVNDLIQARVIGGGVAKKGDYPWQASLKVRVKDKSAHWCGAIIISSRWVLTAGHCLQGYTKGAYIIVAGEYNTDEIEGTEQQKYIDEFFVHEGFRKGHKLNNDIALIKVKGNGFELNDDVQPICLADADTDYSKELNCTISGFGSVKSGVSAYSHNLLQAWIPIHSKEICTMPHIYGDVITDGMFCAGSLDGGLDACDGDSGGPLACLDHGVFTLYGITSWGHHCGHANKPGVYVKVGKYRDWIEDIISKHSQ